MDTISKDETAGRQERMTNLLAKDKKQVDRVQPGLGGVASVEELQFDNPDSTAVDGGLHLPSRFLYPDRLGTISIAAPEPYSCDLPTLDASGIYYKQLKEMDLTRSSLQSFDGTNMTSGLASEVLAKRMASDAPLKRIQPDSSVYKRQCFKKQKNVEPSYSQLQLPESLYTPKGTPTYRSTRTPAEVERHNQNNQGQDILVALRKYYQQASSIAEGEGNGDAFLSQYGKTKSDRVLEEDRSSPASSCDETTLHEPARTSTQTIADGPTLSSDGLSSPQSGMKLDYLLKELQFWYKEAYRLQRATRNLHGALQVHVKKTVPSRWIELHRVCRGEHCPTFSDRPRAIRLGPSTWSLHSEQLITDLQVLIEGYKRTDVAFIATLEYHEGINPGPGFTDAEGYPNPHDLIIQILHPGLEMVVETLLEEAEFGQEGQGNIEALKHKDISPKNARDSSFLEDDNIEPEKEPDGVDKEHDESCRFDTFFFHHVQEFQKKNETLMGEVSLAFELLLNCLTTYLNAKHSHARDMFREGYVDVHSLKYLFPQHSYLVYQQHSKIPRVVLQTKCILEEGHGPTVGHLFYQSWIFRKQFCKDSSSTIIPRKFFKDGKQLISSLPIYPLRYADEQVKNLLYNRARRYRQFREKAYVSYTGFDASKETHYNEARVIVDMKTYWELHAASSQKSNQDEYQKMIGDLGLDLDFNRWNTSPEISAEEPQPQSMDNALQKADVGLLAPTTVYGFDIQEKKWVHLLVDNISDIQWDDAPFNSLTIDAQSKKLIKALVINKLSSDKATDFVTGKGNGLVMLLHGSPGTGKTLSAESVAEIARKPLYRVTCGDIGTQPREVEEYLTKVFHLGKIWDCVVLLDEADVFLEQRSLQDLARNALVSVFLRTLEYYDGILILTSNRVGTFDEAFKSRIQLALHYPKLTAEQRRRIWSLHITRVASLEQNFDPQNILKDVDRLAEFEMNGRQIRNSITTARQLALYERQPLKLEHLDDSIAVSARFDQYLKTVKAEVDDEDIARELELR